MKANELRIGNYLSNNAMWQSSIMEFQVKSLLPHKITTSNGLTLKYVSLAPIPLTKEWLLKFGFVISDSESNLNYTYAKIDGFCINTYQEEKVGYWWLGFYHNKKNNRIQYVHQLQNLYFALTNEELILTN
jgi:hypothetical protein